MLLSKRGFSQNYQTMLDQGAEWHLTWCDEFCKTEVYYTDGDTTHNGHVYKVLNGFHYISREFWLREDISSQKVWLSLTIDSKRQEYLLYNYSVQAGDSIAMYNPISPFPLNGGTYVVDSIVPKLLLDGEYHRFYYFSPTAAVQYPQYPIWVEGLGSLSIVNAPGGTPDWFSHGRISCYFKENGQIYEDLDTANSCNLRYLGSSTQTNPIKKPNVQVHYRMDKSVVWLRNIDGHQYEYSIWDSKGRKIRSNVFENASSGYEVPMGNIGSGYYLIRLRKVGEEMEYSLPILLPQ